MNYSASELATWYTRPRAPAIPEGKALELYFQFHPRTAFLKTLAHGAVVLDVGAGDGSLILLRGWPEPDRSDLKMYAYSLEKGGHFDGFDGYELGDWNDRPPAFAGLTFDAIVCAHFIEHVAEPLSLVAWSAERLGSGGRLYLEWPSPYSQRLPTLAQLKAEGMNLVISNYHDDCTHRPELPDAAALSAALRRHGFRIESQGTIRLPWLEDELLAHFRDGEDPFPRQAAFWSLTRWSQYLIAERGPD